MPNDDADPDSEQDPDLDSDSELHIPPTPLRPLGPRLLDAAERRFGKWAIPGIVRYVAILQGLTYILVAAFDDYYGKLLFNKQLILQGEVWRLVTYLFTPPGNMIPGMGTGNFLIVILVIFFMFMINDGLEQAWGAFRLNVYLISSMVLMTIAAFLFNSPLDPSFLTFSSLLMAFACYYPNVQFLFMLFIPMKIKYLGWFNAAIVILVLLGSIAGGAWGAAIWVIAGMTPFLVVFTPGFIASRKLAAENAVRREKFQAGVPDFDEAFHRCSICDATEQSNPEKEFRVAADGEEYCVEHLPNS